MGYMHGYGSCCACTRLFAFNIHKVPSYNGKPICRTCIEAVNQNRKEAGRPLWPVPEDAYDAEEVDG